MSPTPSPLKHGGTAVAIADGLRHAILHGDYLPGERIVQDQLAQKYGGSRIPVREALRALEAEGLVRLVANTGAWVASLTMAECSEVYQTRERLEPLLLRYSAEGLTGEKLDELDSLAGLMESTSDIEQFLELDRDFHLRMYQGASTLMLQELVTRLWNTTQPYRRAYTKLVGADNRRIFHSEHHMMVTALRDGDLELAEQVLAMHIRRTRLHLERHPEIFHDEQRD
jgi:DNA-binding GntR family transcriptional regulator